MSAKPPPPRSRLRRAKFVVLACVLAASGYVTWRLWRLPDPTELVKKTPAQSALMERRVAEALEEGKKPRLRHKFVPLARISPALQRAVVLGEDARFWMHDGIDWGETRKAVAEAWEAGELGRGASTITQQLAKNLYLSNNRSVVRKLEEWMLADRLEERLSKKRILELYLNFAEWGEGVFGIEMAAQVHFGKSAAELDAAEAAVLTAMLPAPRKRDPKTPSKNLVRRAHKIADLLVQTGQADRADIDLRIRRILGR